MIPLHDDVTTIGRGAGVDIKLDDPSVSRLHAELVRRGRFVYVSDLGLSSNGTRVNGRPIGRRVLADGDLLSLGGARVRVGGLIESQQAADSTVQLRRGTVPALSRPVLAAAHWTCPPADNQNVFAA